MFNLLRIANAFEGFTKTIGEMAQHHYHQQVGDYQDQTHEVNIQNAIGLSGIDLTQSQLVQHDVALCKEMATMIGPLSPFAPNGMRAAQLRENNRKRRR